ncbi:hypothetical protein M8C21_019663 [Ambrosia artemisiifolia]|uniref:non-specific serine/threonine protein kinase n=1 Tax=Ambrosia artemisiifolia TaxID=4212 RepID=A0AAD5G542_AMBAR|nr:hypothetical protein M8C21_019663 [Ambrosia artemisiifolia]
MENRNCSFIFTLTITLVILNIYPVSTSKDQQALYAIRAQITADPSGHLSKTWITNTSICTWTGVSCGFRIHTQRVIALDLSDMGLVGRIPPQIGSLSYLTSLDLSNNSFNGPIPHEITQLRDLERVYMGHNNLTGTLSPFFLENMPSLKSLNLSYNSLNGNIPKEIGNNLSGLQDLVLNNNQISGLVPQTLFNRSSIRRIQLSFNSFSGTLPDDMCDQLVKLRLFFISGNKFTGSIPSSINKCHQLRYLSMSKNNFNGSIPREIGNLTLLKELFLGENDLQGTIPNEFGNLDHLEELDLSDNHFTGSFPFNISRLKALHLTNNSLSGVLPTDLGFMLPNLQGLFINENKFQGPLPSSIINATKLSQISIVSNSFTGIIPTTMGRLEHLEVFACGGNHFTTEGLEPNFLSSLTHARKLRILSFAQNPLKTFLPASIGNWSTTLQTFQAHECGIKGNIPSGIGNLTNLLKLGLDNNELEGNIPTTLGKLQNLGQLFLENNKLQGRIPQQFCDLKNLEELYLSNNRLSGIIPPCFGDIDSLAWLFLDSNTFTSTIPSTLWRHKSLVVLNLSSNLLTGNIPSSTGISNSPLNGLDLSFNRISGDIPSSIGGYQMLNKLSLSHNNLQGSIPASLGTLVSLELLDLSQNILSGLIPRSLEALKHLQYLNLSYNLLQGEIPSGGLFTNFSASSFIHNKDLCGATILQVLSCRSKQHISRALSVLKYVLPITASIMGLVVAAYLLRRHRKHIRTKVEQPLLHEWARISYYELVRATKSFDVSNLIGNGAYGSVYKGELSVGVIVAVKVFNLLSERAIKSFEVECEVLRNIRHRNLNKVISSCTNKDFRCIVMEYMENGSLEQWLYSHNNHLTLVQRLQIMIDVASALEYLHHGQTTPIIHCDLKPSNVLLDEDMNARVCDFGIAKIFGEDDFILRTTTLGTIGYMAPGKAVVSVSYFLSF